MRRYAFYLAVALLAFGIGSIAVFKLYWITKEKPTLKEETKITVEVQMEETKVADEVQTEKHIGFGTGYGVRQLNEPEYVPKLYKPTCNDRKLLPIWNELRKDKEFQQREAEGFYREANCGKMLDVKKIDLNGDGRKEIVLWGNNFNLCGATGNCALWIYEQKKGNYKLLLQSTAYNSETKWFEVKKGKTKGYRNLLLKGHFSGYETDHSFYQFNGDKYVETKCWFEIYSLDEEKPIIMTCKEYNEKVEKELRESEERLKNQ